jgi:hypothetical protein
MKKIKDGTYRAMRMDASGYVYGEYLDKQGRYKHAPKGHFIDPDPNDGYVTPIKRDTLLYRQDGKWVKV